MKLLILLLTLFSIQQVSAQNTEHLKKMRTGKFVYADSPDQSVIIRTKRTQTEIGQNGYKVKLKIEWTSDSTYVLIRKKAENAEGCLKKNDWIKTTITECSENQYTAYSTSENCGSGTYTYIRIE